LFHRKFPDGANKASGALLAVFILAVRLKSTFYIISGLALLITLITGGALDVITTNMHRESQEAESTGKILILTQDLIRKVGISSRLNNTWLFNPTKELKVRRDQTRAESFDVLTSLNKEPLSPADRQFVGDMRVSLKTTYATQDLLDANGLPKNPVQVVNALSNLVDRMHLQIDPFIQRKSERLLSLAADSKYYEKLSDIVGRGAVVISLVLFFVLIWILQTAIVDPLFGLVTAINKFQRGNKKIRIQLKGLQLAEVKSAASGFNHLADSIERLDHRRVEYLVGVAHDLKNPVTAMKMGINLLRSKDWILSPEKAQEILKMISLQTTRLECMITDWMEVQRVEEGDLEYQMFSVDIREIVDECVDLWQAVERSHKIKVVCPDYPLMIQCDPGRIARVINNLLSNAIKYSPNQGAIEILVEKEGAYVALSIHDCGLGISKDDLSHLFEPFRRSIAVKDFPGVGIGLSTSQKLIKAHGGEITVSSRLNQGSTFKVLLPISRRHLKTEKRAA
jgi:two-component system sensor histidine kinase MtrB